MSEELKPCPRCGKAPEQFGVYDAYRCKDVGCGATNNGWQRAADWNKRVPCPNCKRMEAILKDLLGSFTRKMSIGSIDNVLEARMYAATIAEYRAALSESREESPLPPDFWKPHLPEDFPEKPAESKTEEPCRCEVGDICYFCGRNS